MAEDQMLATYHVTCPVIIRLGFYDLLLLYGTPTHADTKRQSTSEGAKMFG